MLVSGAAGFCYGSLVRRPVFKQFDRSQLRITRVALILLFALLATSLLFGMSSKVGKARMAEWLVPTGDSVWHSGKVWTLLTGPFLEVDILSLVLAAFMLWMFLPVLERWWGPRRFALFVGVTAVVGTITGTLIGLSLGGLHVGVPIIGLDSTLFAAAIAFGIIHAKAPIQFFGVLPMTGRQFMWGMIAVLAAVLIIGQQWESAGANVAATAAGAALASGRVDPIAWWRRRQYAKARKHLSSVPASPAAPPTARRSKTDDRWVN